MAITLEQKGDSYRIDLGSQMKITKEEKYFLGHELVDKYYKFGFRWRVGFSSLSRFARQRFL